MRFQADILQCSASLLILIELLRGARLLQGLAWLTQRVVSVVLANPRRHFFELVELVKLFAAPLIAFKSFCKCLSHDLLLSQWWGPCVSSWRLCDLLKLFLWHNALSAICKVKVGNYAVNSIHHCSHWRWRSICHPISYLSLVRVSKGCGSLSVAALVLTTRHDVGLIHQVLLCRTWILNSHIRLWLTKFVLACSRCHPILCS